MGMFPYECKVCGGGDERCGAGCGSDCLSDCGSDCEEDHTCTGGQFCWEPTGVLYPVAIVHTPAGAKELDEDNLPEVLGKYDGYGGFTTEFDGITFFTADEWDNNPTYNENHYVIVCWPYCYSCFMTHYEAIHDSRWTPDTEFYRTAVAEMYEAEEEEDADETSKDE